MNVNLEMKAWRRLEIMEFQRAQAHAPYNDDALVGKLTRQMVEAGKSLFQLFRLHPDDDMHVARLLGLFDLPQGARVLDVGCGVGTMASIMQRMRPDLHITLLNVSRAQLDMCPPGFERVPGDMHAVPLASGSFDALMVCYALGHSLLPQLSAEIARLLRPGGTALFVDIFANDEAPHLARQLGYVGYQPSRLTEELRCQHFRLDGSIPQEAFTLPDWVSQALDAQALEGVIPLAMRFRKV